MKWWHFHRYLLPQGNYEWGLTSIIVVGMAGAFLMGYGIGHSVR